MINLDGAEVLFPTSFGHFDPTRARGRGQVHEGDVAEWNGAKVDTAYLAHLREGSAWSHMVRGGLKEGFVKMSTGGAAVGAQ